MEGPVKTTGHAEVPLRSLLAAVAANLGIALAKIVAFAFTRSASMLAESIHSVADTSNELLMLWGGRRSRREPDEAFSFGYARERYFWSFIVAVMLFTVGGLYSIAEGLSKLRGPHQVLRPGWALAVIVVAAALEAGSLRVAVTAARSEVGPDGWWRFIRRTKSPELPVVLLEDSGALVGLALALGGVGLTLITGNPAFDALASIGIGIVLVLIAVVLAREMKGLLIGESADASVAATIHMILETQPTVDRIAELRTQHLGPDTLLVTAKVVFNDHVDAPGLVQTIESLEDLVVDRVPGARFVYFTPSLG